MSVIDTLITDRNLGDVNRVAYLLEQWNRQLITDEEAAEWENDLKGTYNASDLNRVGTAVAYIRDLLAAYGYVVNVNPKTDWTDADIPTADQLAAYLADIVTIRAAVPQPSSTPNPPATMDRLTYISANNIEKILQATDNIIERMVASFIYSGTVFSGQIWAQFGG